MNTTEPNIQAEDPFLSPYLEGNSEPQGNVLTGTLGAFLFSFIGVAAMVGLYRLHFFSGWVGVLMVFATMKGYKIFGKEMNLAGKIICGVISVIMLLAAYFGCFGYDIYQAYKVDYSITYFDALHSIPDFLSDPQVSAGVVKDLLIGTVLTLVAFIYFTAFKSNSKKRKGPRTLNRL